MSDALIWAVKKNEVALVKRIIEGGMDVNGVDDGGWTALWWAAHGGFVECAKLLLEAKADVNKAEDGWAPLHIASDNGHVECVKLLIEGKANVNAKTSSGSSVLHFAAPRENLTCIEMLIQAGAQVDALRSGGVSPLAYAILYSKPDAAEVLLDKGAKMINVHEDVEIPDWMKDIVAKREKVKRALLTFIGVLRKRFAVSGGGTEYTRGRLPRDVVGVISRWAWSTRFDKRWAEAVPERNESSTVWIGTFFGHK